MTLQQIKVQDNRIMVQAVTPKLITVHEKYKVVNKNAAARTCNHHHILGLFLACYDSLGRAKSGKPVT